MLTYWPCRNPNHYQQAPTQMRIPRFSSRILHPEERSWGCRKQSWGPAIIHQKWCKIPADQQDGEIRTRDSYNKSPTKTERLGKNHQLLLAQLVHTRDPFRSIFISIWPRFNHIGCFESSYLTHQKLIQRTDKHYMILRLLEPFA